MSSLESVCHANRIRSKMLKAILDAQQQQGVLRGISRITSSGTHANGGEASSPESLLEVSLLAEAALHERGLSYDWTFTRFAYDEESTLYLPVNAPVADFIAKKTGIRFASIPEIFDLPEKADPKCGGIQDYREYLSMLDENTHKLVDYINSHQHG